MGRREEKSSREGKYGEVRRSKEGKRKNNQGRERDGKEYK